MADLVLIPNGRAVTNSDTKPTLKITVPGKFTITLVVLDSDTGLRSAPATFDVQIRQG